MYCCSVQLSHPPSEHNNMFGAAIKYTVTVLSCTPITAELKPSSVDSVYSRGHDTLINTLPPTFHRLRPLTFYRLSSGIMSCRSGSHGGLQSRENEISRLPTLTARSQLEHCIYTRKLPTQIENQDLVVANYRQIVFTITLRLLDHK